MIDLHSHSTASDGTYSPQALIDLAYRAGVRLFAITDHDTLSGFLSVDKQVLPSDFRLVSGVEISCTHTLTGGFGKNQALNKIIHVVALDVMKVDTLQTWLLDIQNSRATRGLAIVQKLGDLLPIVVDEFWQAILDKVGGNERAVGRAHIAQTMVSFGLVTSIQDAFDKFLADNKPAYVAIKTPSMSETIATIHACGGLSVLAHPTRYGLSATRTRRLITDFAELGGQACELPNNEPLSTCQMIDRELAKNNLLVSVGSDFHGTTMPWRRLGKVAKPKAGQVGVWEKFH